MFPRKNRLYCIRIGISVSEGARGVASALTLTPSILFIPHSETEAFIQSVKV